MKLLLLACLLFSISPNSLLAQDDLMDTYGYSPDTLDVYSDGDLDLDLAADTLMLDSLGQLIIDSPTLYLEEVEDPYDKMMAEIERDIRRQQRFEEREENKPSLWLFLLFLLGLPISIYIHSWIQARRHKNTWESGVFPQNLAFKNDNLMQAYLRLAALMVKADPTDSKRKFAYMANYFQQKFPGNDIDFNDTLKQAYKFPIDAKTVTHWLNKHLNKKHQRIQILHFLVGLSFIDGSINSSELKVLKNLTALLKLGQKELDSLIAMQKDYKQDSYKEREKVAPRVNSKELLIKRSSKILGVSITATADEIKKAYRKLAKLHHPDLFSNESPEQQRMAEERFIEVNNAYEQLLKLKFD
ncbi:MAG: DnaJ like chaperone protein [Crocinitomicaceae bacterium]|jgi:DnaJ like chaperone protein